MARHRSGRGFLRTLARYWKEGLILVGLNTWVVSEVSHKAIMDALSERKSDDGLTPEERQEFERLVRQAQS